MLFRNDDFDEIIFFINEGDIEFKIDTNKNDQKLVVASLRVYKIEIKFEI